MYWGNNMFKQIAALLRKKPEPLALEPFPVVKKRPTIKKATTRKVAEKAVKKDVKKEVKKAGKK